MIEERGGWFVKNVKDATWMQTEAFGKACGFDTEDPFPQVGIHIFLLEPDKPNCRYHREEAQEDFLVLAGRCKLLVNGEEHPLKTWDLVHCPAGVSHVFVGDGPCALLAIGHRPGKGKEQLFYPALVGGSLGNGSRLTGIGRTVVVTAAGDINQFEREARRQFSQSSAFELVTSPQMADYVMVMEADFISPDFRRRMRGILKLVDAKTGDEAYRRRVTFASISTRSDLNRELTAAVNLMEEWAADVAR